MIIRAGGEIRRLLQLLLKVENSFLLLLTVGSHLLEELVKGNDLGAMWEAMLVGEVAWETWEARLVCDIWEAKGAVWEARLMWETLHQSLL